ncbi:uncharacterized protein LOC127898847 [Citrus sinensis]|uniref:uncharacterized protein LOC112098992 n=1 Tax=Citrus clementina TaxID=85681 RepID=UPI000CED0693|nr:uncharacterized protein LOC112098992 [Citrus x clementina]XP_052287298.1 uncharacterized protein LOC127898847 [Citrus sinensis]
MGLPQVGVRQENRSAGEQVNELRGRINDLNQEREREELRDPHRANELEQRMMQFQKTLEALEAKTEGKKVVGRLLLDDESPLVREVMVVTLPPKYVVPALVYEGKTDPNHHVEKFNEMTGIQGLNDFQRCHVFPLTIEGQAREWYRRLNKGSIGNFKELCALFAVRCRGSCIPEQDTSKLKKLVQREFESLRSFVTRYHKEVTDLGAFDHPDALEGLKKGLRINRLWNSLYSKGITTYAEAYDHVKLDMKTEDAEEEKRRMEMQTGGPMRKGDLRRRGDNFGYGSRMNTGRGREGGNNYGRNQRENRVRDYNRLPPPVDQRGLRSDNGVNLLEQSGRYTPLNTSRAEIYAAIKDKGLLTPPKQIVRGLGGSAHHKYCEFHKVTGHGTVDCIDLKEQIEWLVQNQYLKEYVDDQERGRRRGDIIDNVAMMIMGGPTLAGDSNRSRRNYSRYSLKSFEVNFNVPAPKKQRVQRVPIMFTDEDEEAVAHPHEDALIVKVVLAGQELN